MVPVYEDCMEALLDHPARQLVVYGTLAPGQPNHELLASLSGEWALVEVPGLLGQDVGVPTFVSDRSARLQQVDLFCSADLPGTWRQLDEFEGARYPRRFVVYRTDNKLSGVANLYEYSRRRCPKDC
jgi:gamma-glutamylcyclotransferase (GGCT)/AIG2-like uncharacterized protein YtfP